MIQRAYNFISPFSYMSMAHIIALLPAGVPYMEFFLSPEGTTFFKQ
jgi:hypothetical protein